MSDGTTVRANTTIGGSTCSPDRKPVERTPFVVIALCFHWLILGFLCVDALHAHLLGVATRLDTAVAFISGVWLIAAVSWYLFRPDRVMVHASYVLAFYSCLLGLGGAAYALSLFFRGNTIYAPHIS